VRVGTLLDTWNIASEASGHTGVCRAITLVNFGVAPGVPVTLANPSGRKTNDESGQREPVPVSDINPAVPGLRVAGNRDVGQRDGRNHGTGFSVLRVGAYDHAELWHPVCPRVGDIEVDHRRRMLLSAILRSDAILDFRFRFVYPVLHALLERVAVRGEHAGGRMRGREQKQSADAPLDFHGGPHSLDARLHWGMRLLPEFSAHFCAQLPGVVRCILRLPTSSLRPPTSITVVPL